VAVKEDSVRAAGGVVWRRTGAGELEVLLVHRLPHDDWTFPKGKALGGERDEACALREVEEETGLRCVLESALGEVRYRDRAGRPKVVRYWAMRPVGGVAAPRNEVDGVRWTPVGGAAGLLTYERDRAILAGFARMRETRPPGRRA
jgi:8-oxo-dGTP diphosphatase